MSARKLQFVDPVKDDFLCVICHEPWNPDEASVCNACQGIFCAHCYDEKSAKGTACLHCKVDPATFTAPHRLVRGLAESLEVRCFQSGFGCTWTGTRKALTAHDAECAFKPKPVSYVGPVASDLLCPICHEPFTKPVQLPCEHVFCHQCLSDSLSRREECPVDRQPATPGAISEPPKVIEKMIDDLQVYCVNRGLKVNPCMWQGRRRDYEGHRVTCTAAAAAAVTAPAPATTTTPPPAAAAAPSATKSTLTVSMPSEFPSFVAHNTSDDFCVMAHVTAPTMERVEDRKKPLSISAVIDVSGSMSGAKLNTMVSALKFMVDELTDRDEFGIVSFSSSVTTALHLTRMDAIGKQSAMRVIGGLRAGGSTNLAGGLFSGIDQVKRIDSAPPADDYSISCKRRPCARYPPATAADIASTITFKAWSAPVRRDGSTFYKYGVQLDAMDQLPRTNIKSILVNPGAHSLDHSTNAELLFENRVCASVLSVTVRHKFGETEISLPLKESDVATTTVSYITGKPPGNPAPIPTATPAASDIGYCRAVLLFTDGQANIGITDAASFAEPMRTALAGNEDIVVHTFGFGADHNAALLRAIAENAAGTYYFIKGVDSLKESFADCLGGLMSTVAQNVKLTFTTTANFTLSRTLTTFPVAAGSSDSTVTITLRDLYSGETRDVLFLLKPRTPMAASSAAVAVGSVSVVYDSLLTGKADAATSECKLVPAAEKHAGEPNTQVAEQRARIQTTEAMKEARAMADAGNITEAKEKLRRMKSDVAHAPQTAVTAQLCVDMDEIDDLMASATRWNSEGSKKTEQYSAGYAQQRMNRAGVEMTEGLAQMDNMFKAAMRKKSKN